MAATARKYETEIHGNVIHLVQPKPQNNKKRGKKSEVYPYEIQDVKRLLEYFEEKELVVNITEHELVPKHILLTDEEKKILLKK